MTVEAPHHISPAMEASISYRPHKRSFESEDPLNHTASKAKRRTVTQAEPVELEKVAPSKMETFSSPATVVDKSVIVASVAQVIQAWIKTVPQAPTTIFSGNASVSLEHFVSALVDLLNYLQCDETVLLTAITYLKRISVSTFAITEANIFRLLLASMLVSVKFCDDVGITNQMYAQLVGLELKDVMALERNFLTLMDFQFYIGEHEFVSICSDVRAAVSTPRVQ